MKKLFFVFVALSFLAACNSTTTEQKSDAQAVKIDSTKLASFMVRIQGMTCTGCENTVKTAVAELPGVADVSASFADGIAKVSYDTTLIEGQQIAKAITDKGYEVTGFERIPK
jgi:copper chaperone CopZ